MARYIDADPFEKQLNRYVEYNDDGEQEINADDVFITLHEQPTADVVERKRGKWKPHPTEREWDFCSNCGVGVHRREYGYNEDGTEWVEEVSYIFCPWCGARMEVNDGEIH